MVTNFLEENASTPVQQITRLLTAFQIGRKRKISNICQDVLLTPTTMCVKSLLKKS